VQAVSAPRPLVALLALEGFLLIGLGVADGVVTLLGGDADRAPALAAAAFAIAIGAVLLVLARAVSRGHGWARGPAVALNLFPVVLGASLLGSGVWWVAVPLLLLGGSVLLLFARPGERDTLREG
jgi:hypothetical protein